ncbi:hypothetical protein ACFX12_006418 [Malus domestica]
MNLEPGTIDSVRSGPYGRSSALTTSFSSSSLVIANKPEMTMYKKTKKRKMKSLSFLLSAVEESRIGIKSFRVFKSNPSLQVLLFQPRKPSEKLDSSCQNTVIFGAIKLIRSKNRVLLFEGRTRNNGVEMQIEKTIHEAAGESTASFVGGSRNVPSLSPQHRICSAPIFKCRNYPPPPPQSQPPQQ